MAVRKRRRALNTDRNTPPHPHLQLGEPLAHEAVDVVEQRLTQVGRAQLPERPRPLG